MNDSSNAKIIRTSADRRPEQSNSDEMTESKPKTNLRGIRKGTGPRTQLGKERSKRNSITHGIFSDLVVLQSESKSDFDALLNAIWKDRRPEGALEESLVGQLVVLLWRRRRVCKAETAEIQARSEFVQWDENERHRQDAARLSLVGCGLTLWIANPEALQGCLDLLGELKEAIQEHGFDPDHDQGILTRLYGSNGSQGNWKKTLQDSYLDWLNTARCSEEEPQQNGYTSPQECEKNFVEEVNDEIRRLEHYRQQDATISARRLQLEVLRQSVPESPRLDQLLKYETGISREIDRTLNQLERLQRMRLGQTVPPPINLSVTTSRD